MDPRAFVAGLACWHGPVDPQPIPGGITNLNFGVVDRGQRYFVRIGDDIPEHGIVRANELASNRAAHAVGIAPAVIHSQPGALVLEFIPGRTFTPADVRDPGNLERIVVLLKRCHRDIPRHLHGARPVFSVFQVVRDYARTLAAAGSRHGPALPRLLDSAARLESALGQADTVFGHNDLLATNFIDDGRRLWLVDWEYAGFNSPLFDLAGLASNNEFPASLRNRMLELYFGSPPDDGAWPALRRDERGVALARDDVEHGVGDPLQGRLRLPCLHRGKPGAFRSGARRLQRTGRPMSELPRSARIVIVGGGIIGCSVAYHLGRMGITDCILIERGKLSSGSSWHAAGLVGQLRSNANVTQLLGYSVALYDKLEAETGLATGWKMNGGLRLACNAERWIEVKRQATTAHSFGLEMHLLSPTEARDLWPPMIVDDVVGAAFLPTDGQANPGDIVQALARGARTGGVAIHEETRVTGIRVENGILRGIETDRGAIACEKLVLCAGQWTRDLGLLAGVNVPLVSVQHQYLVTTPIEGVTRGLPTLRDPDRLTYFKEEVGGLVMGGYEPNPIPWATGGLPSDFQFTLLDSDWDHFTPIMEQALARVPALATAGVKQLVNGPESFTPDGNFILGQAPEVKNIFVGAGFNAFGIASAGGAGMALAEWVVHGEPPSDLWPVDIRRFGRHHQDIDWVRTRTLEAYGKHYTMAWPAEEYSVRTAIAEVPAL